MIQDDETSKKGVICESVREVNSPSILDQVSVAKTSPSKCFFRRPLPSSCVDFSSALGKDLFISAITKGHGNIYFKLSSQFRTQDEPAFCGVSTLVMVLNALDVDPGRVWKRPWRFYHETMLDCCISLEEMKIKGITLAQFRCLAACNRLETDLKYANFSKDYLNTLREAVKRSVVSEDTVLVVSYDRQLLGQTGTGHFSPVGAYHEESDRILIMDVARFKYPPHWVELETMQKAMCSIDSATDKPRGYILLKLCENLPPSLLLSIKANYEKFDLKINQANEEWEKFLLEPQLDSTIDEKKLICQTFEKIFLQYISFCEIIFERIENDEEDCCMTNNLEKCCINILCNLKSLEIMQYMKYLGAAALLLAWPLEDLSPRSRYLMKYLQEMIVNLDLFTLNELKTLNAQLIAII